MTTKITPEAVKERIAALESAGELSLKEQFYLEALRQLVAAMDSEPVAYISKSDFDSGYPHILARRDFNKACTMAVYAAQPAPVVNGEYGNAYQGAREDLAIWKRRALEAEESVRRLEQINDHLVKEAQGESRMGEPVIARPVPVVPDGIERVATTLEHIGNFADAAIIRQRAANQQQNAPQNIPEIIPDICTWHCEEDINNWHSDCGYQFQFMEDGPEENGVKFCPKCGKPVQLAQGAE